MAVSDGAHWGGGDRSADRRGNLLARVHAPRPDRLNDFERVPLGKFTWASFVLCSLGSALEHPQWGVGIACWVVYNLLFYWKKSLLCLMITHGITNLALYVYVFVARDWIFWS